MQLLYCVVKRKWTGTAETAHLLKTNMFSLGVASTVEEQIWAVEEFISRLRSGSSYVQIDSLSMYENAFACS